MNTPATLRDSATRKTLIHCVPVLMGVYFVASIDRANIAMAKESLHIDIGLTAAAYGLGAGIFAISYAVLEIPSNVILHRVGAKWWIGRISVSFGVITFVMIFVRDEWSFYLVRILLGAAEAGLFPGLMYLVTVWFPQANRARVVGYILAAATLAGITGPVIGGGLMSLGGMAGLRGWQWMFLVEGAVSVLVGIYVWLRLPSRPHDARWLTRDEADALVAAVEPAGPTHAAESVTWSGALSAMRSPAVLTIAAMYFLLQVGIGGPMYFGPAMVAEWGVSGETTIGLVVGLITIGPLLGVALVPRIYRHTGPGSERVLIAGAVGIATVAAVVVAQTGGFAIRVVMLSLSMLLFIGIATVVWAYVMNGVVGLTAAAVLAFVNTVGAVGAFFGPFTYGVIEETTGTSSRGMLLVASVGLGIVVLALLLKPARPRTANGRSDASAATDLAE